MAQGVKLTPSNRQNILDLVADGYSYAEVVKMTGFGLGTVCRTVRQYGHPPPDRWTEATIREPLERLYRRGAKYHVMADRLGLSRSQLKRWLRRFGLTRSRQGPDVAEMVRLRNEGLFYREIAARTGWSKDTVSNRLRHAAGVNHRPAAERQRQNFKQWVYRDGGRYYRPFK